MGKDKRIHVQKNKPKTLRGKVWHFLWHDDSWLSWFVNIVLAFVIIKFVVYPGLGLMLSTTHPVVAVVSGSMYHGLEQRDGSYELCGNIFPEKNISNSYENWWKYCGGFYTKINISKKDFKGYKMSNGFSKGDIIILKGVKPQKIKIGDIIVFRSNYRSDPIIHRVILIKNESGKYFFTTKGDHNLGSGSFEMQIKQDMVIGRAVLRLPYLGYVKIWAFDALSYIKVIR